MTRIGDIHSTVTIRLKSSSSFFLLPGWSWMSNCYYYSHRSLRNRPMNQRRVVEPPRPYPRPPPHRPSWSTCIWTRMKWECGGGCLVLAVGDFAVVGNSLPFCQGRTTEKNVWIWHGESVVSWRDRLQLGRRIFLPIVSQSIGVPVPINGNH